MRFGAYILLLTALTIILYFMGFTSIVTAIEGQHTIAIANQQGTCTVAGVALPVPAAYCPDNATLMGAIFVALFAATALVAFTQGFSAIYVIPIILLIGSLNFFIFPISFILNDTLPPLLKYPLVFIFNVLTVLAVMSFIRGGV